MKKSLHPTELWLGWSLNQLHTYHILTHSIYWCVWWVRWESIKDIFISMTEQLTISLQNFTPFPFRELHINRSSHYYQVEHCIVSFYCVKIVMIIQLQMHLWIPNFFAGYDKSYNQSYSYLCVDTRIRYKLHLFIYKYIPGIVPFLLLLGLNVAIYSKIRQMQKENFDMTRSSALQRQKEIKLSQISIAIAAGR